MIILGLGSNLGFQLDNLRRAIKLLRQIHSVSIKNISPVYQSDALLPANAPAAWNKTFLNLALSCETTLTPEELLRAIKQIELTLGRDPAADRWSPRIIDIDILLWDELIYQQHNLTIPHPQILKRPFVLWPLLDLLPAWQHPQYNIAEILEQWGARYAGNAPFKTKQIPQRVDTPALVGVLNVTPDSFSDGGEFNTPEKALAQAQTLFEQGAEIIDIGAESTRPDAALITPQQEWAILQPVLQAIQSNFKQQFFKPKVSVDTRHYFVAEQAVQIGIDWLNDVTGFKDDAMCHLIAETKLQCVVMHSLSIPPSQQYVLSLQQDACEQVLMWARQRLDKLLFLGVKPEKIIFDVGIGFSKTPRQSLQLIKEIEKFHSLEVALLVGHSRKLFLKLFGDTQPKERDFATALLSFYLTQHHVNYLRVHNVALNAQALRVGAEFK
jgi:2-amino-4-hydroxy-6-hydroxymethyldihydropteridine diphosphokinase / dihydropteroate synthase